MGCLLNICKRKKNEKKVNTTQDEKLWLNTSLKKGSLSRADTAKRLSQKTFSINASTFINEKRYQDFNKEYELGDVVGKGM